MVTLLMPKFDRALRAIASVRQGNEASLEVAEAEIEDLKEIVESMMTYSEEAVVTQMAEAALVTYAQG